MGALPNEPANQEGIEDVFEQAKEAAVVGGIPIADGRLKAGAPFEREEQNGAVIGVGEYVYGSVQAAPERKPEQV